MHTKVRVAGGDIAYEARGRGLPIVFLHAFPLGLVMWEDQVEALGSETLCVRFDCRGFGASSPGEGLLTMERIADDAVALLDHLGLSQAVVCGLSMGGYAAFALARRHPERLKGLVLADTKPGADDAEARGKRAALSEKVRVEGAAAAADALVPLLLGETSHSRRADLVARVREIVLGTSRHGICDALAGLAARADSTPTLRRIGVPTLVVCGDEDTLTPVAEAEAMADAIPDSRLEIIPEAGHLANLENPEAFGAALSGFLATLQT
jgi:pimeloyl-ACP methyl ester carboxylesterase